MCTYQTEMLELSGSGKGAEGWFPLTQATVYFDHPVHAPAEHTLNVDLLNPGRGAAARVAMELDPLSARQLATTILAVLDSAPAAVLTGTSIAPAER
jgi:hypothetical protein